jgi:pyruvate formate lyase activating enzyme
VEVTRLIVPGYSDDLDDLRYMCDWFVRALGANVPLHFSRFHPDYRLCMLPTTPVDVLEKAHEIAQSAGLRYIYIGNVPGQPEQNTICPTCGREVVRRGGYRILTMDVREGKCPCGEAIAGVWS